MLRVRKKSYWSWETSATAGVGFGPFSAGHGKLYLRSPFGTQFIFSYASAGLSLSLGAKLNLSHATADTWSVGEIGLLDTFSRGELSDDDFEGICLIQQADAGAGLGGSAAVMLLGLPILSIPLEVLKLALPKGLPGMPGGDYVLPPAGGIVGVYLARRRLGELISGGAKAALVIAGFNSGPQYTVGIANSVGFVYRTQKKLRAMRR